MKKSLISGLILSITFLTSCSNVYECEHISRTNTNEFTSTTSYNNVTKSEVKSIEKKGTYKVVNDDGTIESVSSTTCYKQDSF